MEPLILLIEPELDERAATATMSRAQKVYEEGARDISRVMRQQLTEGTEAAGRGFDELETKARRAYLGMQDAAEKVAAAERKHEAAQERGAANTEALARRVERARLDEIQAIERATAAYREYESAAQNAGQAGESAGTGFMSGLRSAASGAGQAGEGMADSFVGGFAGSAALMRLGAAGGPIGIGLAAAAALGVTAGKVLMDNIMAGMSTLQMEDTFRARLGVDEATMRRYGDAASEAWVSGFGGSAQDNLSSLQFGIQAGLVDRGASDAEIQAFTAQMDTLQQITEAGAQEIAAGTRNFVKTGLVDSYQEAFDLITAAQQQGLNISGDLLDTAEEYGTALSAVGLTGADSFGLIAQMQAAGIRNTDVAADSIKEMAISVSDGSELTTQAFGALGFNADQLNQKFAEGGPAARQAFGEVLGALAAIEDPVERNQVGMALFKTKWEDAKTAIQAADLNTAADQMGDLNGKTQEATNALSEHANQWDLLGRNISDTISDVQTRLADSGIGQFLSSGIPRFLNENFLTDPQSRAEAMAAAAREAAAARNRDEDFPNRGARQRAMRGLPPLPGEVPPSDGTDRTTPVPMPAAGASGGSASLPEAPSLPLIYSSTAGLPSNIVSAQTRLDEAAHAEAEKQARVNQLKQSNLATADDIQKAENDLTKATQNRLQAEQALTDARINATEKANKQLTGLSNEITELGNQLDADFGLSKGLGGVIENAVKALGNALTAPFLAALGMVEKANPNEGSGLVGMLAANGAFGSQYTPASIAALQAQSNVTQPGYAPVGASPIVGSPGAAQPGQSARDFAHEVMMPFWESQGFTVGDHAADSYGEHQNGAIDIMVDSIAEGNAVLQQVLSDPNVHGAIFNRRSYGYGNGPGGKDMPDRGSPTQNHETHVHAWYKPGGANNITSGGGGVPALSTLPATGNPVTGAPGVPGLAGVPSMPGGALVNGMPSAAPFSGGPGVSPESFGGPGVAPGNPYPSQGGNSGNIVGGLAMDGMMAAAGAADLMMPGAGAAAKIGIQLANRTIGYGAQVGGIIGSGVLETLSLGDNPKGSLGAGWLGKGLGGIAGAAAALPNIAGGKPPGPMTQQGGGSDRAGNTTTHGDTNIHVTAPPGADGDTHGKHIAEHQAAIQAPPGRQP